MQWRASIHANLIFWNLFKKYFWDAPSNSFANLIFPSGLFNEAFHKKKTQTLLVIKSKRRFTQRDAWYIITETYPYKIIHGVIRKEREL